MVYTKEWNLEKFEHYYWRDNKALRYQWIGNDVWIGQQVFRKIDGRGLIIKI